jgi:hypothetical protein
MVWDLEITTGEPEQRVWSERVQSQANPYRMIPWVSHVPTALPDLGVGIPTGTPVQVNATVQIAGGGAADASGSINLPWDAEAGLPYVISHQASTAGGLTPEEAQQLDDTHNWTDEVRNTLVPIVKVDQLATIPITPTPIGGNVSWNLNTPIFGVIVRIATVPPGFLPGTADDDYWVLTLATVRIFRGTDIWMRVPIHTSSRFIQLWGEGLSVGISDFLAMPWLLQLSLQVDFAPGVTGTVTLMQLP